MVQLYTSLSKVPKDIEIVTHVDSYFNQVVLRKLGVGGLPKEYLLQFDGARVYDDNRVSTKFGLCSATLLSTGLKTLCVVMYCKQVQGSPKGVVLTECGNNILEPVFKELDNTDVVGVLQHADVFGCQNRDYSVNGRCVNYTDALRALLLKEVKTYGV